jgi:hypothetical protein
MSETFSPATLGNLRQVPAHSSLCSVEKHQFAYHSIPRCISAVSNVFRFQFGEQLTPSENLLFEQNPAYSRIGMLDIQCFQPENLLFEQNPAYSRIGMLDIQCFQPENLLFEQNPAYSRIGMLDIQCCPLGSLSPSEYPQSPTACSQAGARKTFRPRRAVPESPALDIGLKAYLSLAWVRQTTVVVFGCAHNGLFN